MSGIVIGIDIGLSGAAALMSSDGRLRAVYDMPCLNAGHSGRRTINAVLLAQLLAETHATKAYVEFVSARPGESPSGAFAFGRSAGLISGCLAALSIAEEFLTPAHWKRIVGLPPGKDGAKDRSRAMAIAKWPDHAQSFARVKDNGRSDAALIALAGLRREASHA
jgi:crossover junction endodeoxyribonuclease RuvC